MRITDYKGAWPNTGLDMSDTVMHTCVCGSNLWRVVVSFEDYEIATYALDMECLECGTVAKAPTPIDNPEYKPDSLAF